MATPSPNISAQAQDIVIKLAHGRRCSCGHSVNHVMVGPQADYGVIDQVVQNVIGVSRPPLQLSFRCRVCEEVLLETQHPVVLDSFH